MSNIVRLFRRRAEATLTLDVAFSTKDEVAGYALKFGVNHKIIGKSADGFLIAEFSGTELAIRNLEADYWAPGSKGL